MPYDTDKFKRYNILYTGIESSKIIFTNGQDYCDIP